MRRASKSLHAYVEERKRKKREGKTSGTAGVLQATN